MSSLAAVQADGYYYPPNWDPAEWNKAKNQHAHPLGNRARKLSKGIVIVRFEMPVNVWCEGCGEHIARGVRYNAEKKKCGTYFTSDVFEFQMNCHLCQQRFIIKTDPQNRDYEFVYGLRRKVETFDVKDIGTREFDEKEQALMRMDAIRSLENKEEDSLNFEKVAPVLDRLKDLNDTIRQNEDDLNREVRHRLRENRKLEERLDKKASDLGLNIKLVPITKSDIRKSRSVHFKTKSKADIDDALKRADALSGDIFGKKDKLKEHTLKKCISRGMDLKLIKVKSQPEEKNMKALPAFTAKPILKVKTKKNPDSSSLNLVPYSYDENES